MAGYDPDVKADSSGDVLKFRQIDDGKYFVFSIVFPAFDATYHTYPAYGIFAEGDDELDAMNRVSNWVGVNGAWRDRVLPSDFQLQRFEAFLPLPFGSDELVLESMDNQEQTEWELSINGDFIAELGDPDVFQTFDSVTGQYVIRCAVDADDDFNVSTRPTDIVYNEITEVKTDSGNADLELSVAASTHAAN